MYKNGQALTEDRHFQDHIEHEVPIQVYLNNEHNDIGFVREISPEYVLMNGTLYDRRRYTFISRPGY